MKLKIVTILLCIGIASLTACGGKKTEEPQPEPAPAVEEAQEPVEETPEIVAEVVAETAKPAEPLSPEDALTEYITARITDHYLKTDIDKIDIGEDLGTEEEGDYVALIYLTWNVKNKPEMTEQMLQMYSDDMAASLALDHPEVQAMAVFWEVPYLNASASKWSYGRKDGGMYMDDKVLGF